MAGIRKYFINTKGTKMTATEVKETIDTLKGKLDTFENQLSTLHKDILEKRTAAGLALFEGKDTSQLEDEIGKLESKCKTIDFAKTTTQTKLTEAIAKLQTAKKTDATERILLIRKEVENTALAMEKHLTNAILEAESFNYLLNDALRLAEIEKIPLSPLGAYVNAISRINLLIPIDSILKDVLSRLKQYR
jgi:chaperonin cofactor prefoldin